VRTEPGIKSGNSRQRKGSYLLCLLPTAWFILAARMGAFVRCGDLVSSFYLSIEEINGLGESKLGLIFPSR
jgi:hypothetical protein